MIGLVRVVARSRLGPLLVAAVFPAMLLLAGCTGIRQAIGLDQTAPDEFAVESRAPLTIPPDFDLRPPQPGARPPHQVTAEEKARRVIDTAGPGKPGDQAIFALKPGEGEVAGAQPQSADTVAANTLAGKLLETGDSSAGGTVEQRKTSALEGVH